MKRLTFKNEEGEMTLYAKDWGKAIDKLAKYEDAEEQGRFIEFPVPLFPVALGDTVFVDRETVPCQQKYEPRFIEGQVVSLIKNNRGCQIKIKIIAKWQYSYWGQHIEDDALRAKYFTFSKNSLGITVFKSLEEAEATLKELEDKDGKCSISYEQYASQV